MPVNIEYLASFQVADSSATAPGSLEEASKWDSATVQAAVTSHVKDLSLHNGMREQPSGRC